MSTIQKHLPANPLKVNKLKIESSMDTIGAPKDFSKLWQLAFDASPDMISVLDTDQRIIAVNKAMVETMACRTQEVLGRHCYNLLHNCDKPLATCPHLALLEDGKTHHSVIYEKNLDAWLRITVTPIYNEKKKLLGSIHISQDITALKRSEQAHRESEERYHHLSEATIEGVLLSEQSTIITSNQVLADMMGYSIKELTGMSMLRLVAAHDRARLIHMMRNQRTGINTLTCRRKDGSVFPVQAHTRAVRDNGGTIYQTAIRDLTEQKRIEHERINHERMRGVLELAGAVCHEINQPLMALQGFMDILTAKIVNNEKAPEQLSKLGEQVERIKKLTHKMMHITKYATKDYAGGETIIDLEQAAPEE